jgi:RNA polymerase sigma factor (TIGR02999 family)
MSERPDAQSEASECLTAIDAGDTSAAARLMPLVYAELRGIAARMMARERVEHTLQPTALVHEAFLRLAGQSSVQWRGRAHFMAVAAEAIRRVLVDHARRHGAVKRGDGAPRFSIESADEPARPQATAPIDLLALDDAMHRLAAVDPRRSRVVELRFFAGLTNEEIASVLDVACSTIAADWTVARAWLSRELAIASS